MPPNTLLYQRIALSILGSVRNGALLPGAPVPSEARLAEQFEVSRITSRKALDVLAQSGVVERHRGRGTFVSAELPDIERLMSDLDPLQDVRLAAPIQTHGRPAITLILPDFSENYGLRLVYSIEEACAAAEVNLILRRTYGRQEVEEEAVETALAQGVEGLIVFPVHGEHYNPAILKAVLGRHPLALVDRYLPGIPAPAICTNNVLAAEMLANRLLDLGHTSIAFLSPPVKNTTSIEQRLEGLLRALEARGLTLNRDHQLGDLFSTLPRKFETINIEEDQARLRAFLQNLPDVTAFFVSEFNLAAALVQVLELSGRRVPDDFSVVCFDSPGNPFGLPRFTHVRQDETGMGSMAVRFVLDQMAGRSAPMLTALDFEIVEGRSTARPALRETTLTAKGPNG